MTRPALLAAPRSFIADIQTKVQAAGLPTAIANRQPGPIFDFLVRINQYQGIADAVADAYLKKHGSISWSEIENALALTHSCGLLRSYWDFSDCRYVKGAQTCSHPNHMSACSLPKHPLRKGSLNQSAYSLFLFIRDVCDGDFGGWIDRQLNAAASAQPGYQRTTWMRNALIEPLSNVHGISDKITSMALSDLLLGADPDCPVWIATGASMIAIDTLVHNFLHRTGTLRRAGAEHAYGPPCYATRGCAEIIEELSKRIDARNINPEFPSYFPRFVQYALWRFCAQDEMNVCNGNRINDRSRCDNPHCPSFRCCDRVALNHR